MSSQINNNKIKQLNYLSKVKDMPVAMAKDYAHS